MKTVLLTVLLATAPALAADEAKLGKGVTIKKATPIPALVARPEEYVGKTVRIDGIARAVCAEIGCWMSVVVDDADPSSPTVRLKVDEGAIVFPISAKGKKVSAEGVFEAIAPMDTHAKEAAHEHLQVDPNAQPKYQIKATGAVIK